MIKRYPKQPVYYSQANQNIIIHEKKCHRGVLILQKYVHTRLYYSCKNTKKIKNVKELE